MVLAGLIARELGGRRGAQIVTALVAALMPFSMIAGGVMQYVSIDYLWWVLLAWLLLRLVNSGDARWWLAIGAAIGVGMLTKYTMVFCVAGIVVATLATPLRAHLTSRWLWPGVAVSLLLFLPNALWQWRHEFVSLDFLEAIHARDMRIGRTDDFVLGQLYANAGPFALPIWLLGLGWLVFSGAARRYRMLAWMYAVPLLLFAVAQARAYYMAPAYPMLVAAGCVAAGRWLRARQPLGKGMRRLGAGVLGDMARAHGGEQRRYRAAIGPGELDRLAHQPHRPRQLRRTDRMAGTNRGGRTHLPVAAGGRTHAHRDLRQ